MSVNKYRTFSKKYRNLLNNQKIQDALYALQPATNNEVERTTALKKTM